MGFLLFKFGCPIAFLLCFVVQADISPAQGMLGTIVALPITLLERNVPSNTDLVLIFAATGTFLFGLGEIFRVIDE